MKKYLIAFVAILLVFTMNACSEQQAQTAAEVERYNAAVDSYLAEVQPYNVPLLQPMQSWEKCWSRQRHCWKEKFLPMMLPQWSLFGAPWWTLPSWASPSRSP